MTKRDLIGVEPIEPSGVVLTIAELPGLVIFGQTAEDTLGSAREAVAVQLRDSPGYDKRYGSSWFSPGEVDEPLSLRSRFGSPRIVALLLTGVGRDCPRPPNEPCESKGCYRLNLLWGTRATLVQSNPQWNAVAFTASLLEVIISMNRVFHRN